LPVSVESKLWRWRRSHSRGGCCNCRGWWRWGRKVDRLLLVQLAQGCGQCSVTTTTTEKKENNKKSTSLAIISLYLLAVKLQRIIECVACTWTKCMFVTTQIFIVDAKSSKKLLWSLRYRLLMKCITESE
jgi:hypothetical protein